MGGKNYYVPGDYNVVCDVCSKKIKASDAKQRWDGFIVCPEDYEQRHTQDFVKARQDKLTVPFSRPQLVDEIFNIPFGVNDLITVTDSFERVWNTTNTLNDSVTMTDSNLYVTFSKYLTDTVTISDTTSIQATGSSSLSDNVSPTDAGFFINFNYIDFTYFATDYVGEIYTF